MRAGQRLDVQLADEGGSPLALAGVVIDIDFFVNRDYRFGFRVGQTDAGGRLRVDYETVEGERLRELELQPMDYKTRLDECDDVVRIRVPTEEELRKGVEAASAWGAGQTEKAKSWPAASNRRVAARPIFVALEADVTTTSVVCKLLP